MQGGKLQFGQNPVEFLLAAAESLRGTRAAHRQNGLRESPESIDLSGGDPIGSHSSGVLRRGAGAAKLPKIKGREKPLRNLPRRDSDLPPRTAAGRPWTGTNLTDRDVAGQEGIRPLRSVIGRTSVSEVGRLVKRALFKQKRPQASNRGSAEDAGKASEEPMHGQGGIEYALLGSAGAAKIA